MFALGLMSWLYNRPTEGTIDVHRGEVRASGPRSPTPTRPPSRPATRTARPRRTSPSHYEVEPAKLKPGIYRQITGNTALSYGLVAAVEAVRAAALPRRLPDHARLVDPGGARAAQELRRAHVPGRGRDRRGRRGARRGVRRRARRHDVGRPGDRAQVGDDRARDRARAAAADPRHPARRPLDRDADEAGAGRPADGAVRPQRRVPVPVVAASTPSQCFYAAIEAARIALKYRTPVYLLQRRLPGERRGAVADPRRRRPARHLDRVRDRPARASSCRTCATRRRSRGRGRSRNARARAPHRRPREGRRHRQRSPTTPRTTT